MGATFYLTSLTTDLSGGADFDKRLDDGTEPTASTLAVSVAALATEDSYAYSEPLDPSNADWEDGEWTVKLNVTVADAALSARVRIARVTAAGALVEESALSGAQNLDLVGVKTFTLSGLTWTAGSATDRVRVLYRFINSVAGVRTVTIQVGDGDAAVTSPLTRFSPGSRPTMRARVTLYDAALKRLGRVGTAQRINRSYVLDDPGLCSFLVDADERLLTSMSPIEGRLVVIESDEYPYPWAGKITSLRRDRTSGSVLVSAVGFEQVFEYRFTGAGLAVSGSASAAVEQLLAAINAVNPTGISAGTIAGTFADASTDFTWANAREALDALADLAGAEWWVEPFLTGTGLEFRLNFRPWRGFDRADARALVDPATCRWDDWSMDGEALTYGLTVLGGEASGTQALADRASARVDPKKVDFVGPHGYQRIGPVEGANLLTRQDRFAVVQQLRAEGQMQAAAEAMLARQRAGGVPLSVRLSVPLDADVWAALDVGSVVTCKLPTAFPAGFSGPVRILGAQPREEDGQLLLSVQMLRPRG